MRERKREKKKEEKKRREKKGGHLCHFCSFFQISTRTKNSRNCASDDHNTTFTIKSNTFENVTKLFQKYFTNCVYLGLLHCHNIQAWKRKKERVKAFFCRVHLMGYWEDNLFKEPLSSPWYLSRITSGCELSDLEGRIFLIGKQKRANNKDAIFMKCTLTVWLESHIHSKESFSNCFFLLDFPILLLCTRKQNKKNTPIFFFHYLKGKINHYCYIFHGFTILFWSSL